MAKLDRSAIFISFNKNYHNFGGVLYKKHKIIIIENALTKLYIEYYLSLK